MRHLIFLLLTSVGWSAAVNDGTKQPQQRVWIKYEAGHHEAVSKHLPETVHYHFRDSESFVISGSTKEIERLKAHPRVLNVVDDVLRYRFHSSRRRDQLLQWEDQATAYGFAMIQADVLQESYGLTGENITICVPDTGIDVTHEDLDASKLSGESLTLFPWDEDDTGHGTSVSGILSAQNNSFGLLGVAPNVKLHSIRIFDTEDAIYVSVLLDALKLCVEAGVDIVSLSLGGSYFQTEFDLLTDMYENYGILSIASSGNSGDGTLFYPAAYPNVISVGSVDSLAAVSDFSTQNAMVDLVAPGTNVWSTLPQNFDCVYCSDLATSTYGPLDGTSYSCPYVVGIAALLWSEDTSVGVEYIYNALLASAADLGAEGRDASFGQGLVQGEMAYAVLHDTLRNSTQPLRFQGKLCPGDSLRVAVAILTDQYSFDETYWEVVRSSDNFTVMTGTSLAAQTKYISNACLPANCYTFRAYDLGGDGICCTYGQGSLDVSINGEQLLEGNFSSGIISAEFGGNCTTDLEVEKEPCTYFDMLLRTDDYPEEISVRLESLTTGETWWNDVIFPFEITDYSFLECLDPSECYRFTLFDLYDCLYSPGTLEIAFGGEVIFSGLPEFTIEYMIDFGQDCPARTEAPTETLTETPTRTPTETPTSLVPSTPSPPTIVVETPTTEGISNATMELHLDTRIDRVSNKTLGTLLNAIADALTKKGAPNP